MSFASGLAGDRCAVVVGLVALACGARVSLGALVADGGFEGSSAWTLENDATVGFAGGSGGFVFNTPVVDDFLVIGQESVLPTEGSAMAMSYAGLDEFSQLIDVPFAGEYTVSVDFRGIRGFTTSGADLGTGAFGLFAGGLSSPGQLTMPDDGWGTMEWTVFLEAGATRVGIRNLAVGVYAIAYDRFAVVPSSGAGGLGLVAGVAAGRRRRR